MYTKRRSSYVFISISSNVIFCIQRQGQVIINRQQRGTDRVEIPIKNEIDKNFPRVIREVRLRCTVPILSHHCFCYIKIKVEILKKTHRVGQSLIYSLLPSYQSPVRVIMKTLPRLQCVYQYMFYRSQFRNILSRKCTKGFLR